MSELLPIFPDNASRQSKREDDFMCNRSRVETNSPQDKVSQQGQENNHETMSRLVSDMVKNGSYGGQERASTNPSNLQGEDSLNFSNIFPFTKTQTSVKDAFQTLDRNKDGHLDLCEFGAIFGNRLDFRPPVNKPEAPPKVEDKPGQKPQDKPQDKPHEPKVSDKTPEVQKPNKDSDRLVGLEKMPYGLITQTHTHITDHPKNLTVKQLTDMKQRGIGGLEHEYNLPVDRLLTKAELDFIDRDYDVAREAGMRMRTRFRYNEKMGDADAPPQMILAQMKQLAPVLSKNEDVIGIMDMGFVGAWGEWHSSTSNPKNDADYKLQKQMYDIYTKALPNTPIAFSHAHTLRELFGENQPNNVMAFDDSIGRRIGATPEQNDAGQFKQKGSYDWAVKNQIMYTGETQQNGTVDATMRRLKELNITSMNIWGEVKDEALRTGRMQEIINAIRQNAREAGIPF